MVPARVNIHKLRLRDADYPIHVLYRPLLTRDKLFFFFTNSQNLSLIKRKTNKCIENVRMAKTLNLYNTFTRLTQPVILSGNRVAISPDYDTVPASLYICGPTVYGKTHLGHAVNYIRMDLFRRLLDKIFRVNLNTVMNITDIDDKILKKLEMEKSSSHSNINLSNDEFAFKQISDHYYNSFLKDMQKLKIKKPDLCIKVTDSIGIIKQFIDKLERSGSAYVAQNNDVYFSVDSLNQYQGITDKRFDVIGTKTEPYKRNPRDFVLWKYQKPGEPCWNYYSNILKQNLPGRPGWHVQCSAIATSIFGERLDFHYGGKDLMFPHHYNEIACSCSYHNIKVVDPNWSANWMHSGHLVIKNLKMSKSLDNTIDLKNLKRSTINALRLLCITTHYRSDIDYSQELMENLMSLDRKINAFCDYLRSQLDFIQSNSDDALSLKSLSGNDSGDLKCLLKTAKDEFIEGICDDFDLRRGLEAIINLSKRVYSLDIVGQSSIVDIIETFKFVSDWCSTCQLHYSSLPDIDLQTNAPTLKLLTTFRNDVRNLAIDELKAKKGKSEIAINLLSHCDILRSNLSSLVGKVISDPKSNMKSES